MATSAVRATDERSRVGTQMKIGAPSVGAGPNRATSAWSSGNQVMAGRPASAFGDPC
jgi:hypothetical protein